MKTVLLILLFVSMNNASILVNAMTCEDAITHMLPCEAFVMGFGQISVPCCQSVQSLIQFANTSPQERTSACQCLKQAAGILGINVARVQQIPKLCHIDVDMSLIDPNIDCNKLSSPSPAPSPTN
ncbi:non-specific lipid-transfer protein 1-like [Rutidosis leptorrhynchoides]|uniref:non-specific lipid-transfer protein 1-like n=1 Tax=Rutidosis leptorrhynchoides TaxID=125765 RepID=UPI003A98DD86